eukprot:COSAG05_NODE_275_length_12406_cov_12.621841_9_plen_68_part_00
MRALRMMWQRRTRTLRSSRGRENLLGRLEENNQHLQWQRSVLGAETQRVKHQLRMRSSVSSVETMHD